MSPLRVGFVGSGKMATAIASGLIKSGKILKNGAADIAASCPPVSMLLFFVEVHLHVSLISH
jgi:hypothetical protein